MARRMRLSSKREPRHAGDEVRRRAVDRDRGVRGRAGDDDVAVAAGAQDHMQRREVAAMDAPGGLGSAADGEHTWPDRSQLMFEFQVRHVFTG